MKFRLLNNIITLSIGVKIWPPKNMLKAKMLSSIQYSVLILFYQSFGKYLGPLK